MSNDYEIGRIVAVDTAQVTVELNRDIKALTRATYEGTIEIGRINSYIIIPVAARRIVAMVTRVVLTEESELKADKNMVILPSSRRLMKATMIGTIDDGVFRQGISIFPVLDTSVLMTTREDLDAIFGRDCHCYTMDDEGPGYCIPIGKSAVFSDYTVKINPDAFFGKHAAVIGSTGSGKSCTIATILQSILEQPEVKHTRFIILDTNGEYRAAFQKKDQEDKWTDAHKNYRALYIPTDSVEKGCLAIPYWFMNSEDFVRLFRAAPGVQRPILLNALTNSRECRQGLSWISLRNNLRQECIKIISLISEGTWQARKSIAILCDGIISVINSEQNAETVKEVCLNYPAISKTDLITIMEEVQRNTNRITEKDYSPIGMETKQSLNDKLNNLLMKLSCLPVTSIETGVCSADTPTYFSKMDFSQRHLDMAMSRDESSSSRTRDACGTMLMRINRLLEDSRFEFLFGPTSSEWPKIKNALATFLRDLIGIGSGNNVELSDEDEVSSGILGFYDRQRGEADQSNVVIIDLSLLATEVLENVTALIARLVHEFLQRLGSPESGVGRGEFPVVLILEEAQNYIREDRKSEEDSISKQVFERIAREGRKYGLGLVVASQRPSELSKTVLSQCNSFIVHRLQNPEDLRYFREIVPGIYEQLLDQLPALAPRNALVLGECVQAPALVEMREVNPKPKSKDPKFFKSWAQEGPIPDVEAICQLWEGQRNKVKDN
ncbi:MAG: DUF87 domain-containing protein [Smithella sp.]